MKQLLFSLFASLLLSVGAIAQSEMTFDSKLHDFGDIKQNIPATYEFEFKNEGTAPLIINGAEASCGCTVPNYPKEPIMPGKSGKITVTYNAEKVGPFKKTVTIDSNDPNSPTELRIEGTVVAAATDAKG